MEFITGRVGVEAFLRRKWASGLDDRLIKELWSFREKRMAARFVQEWRHDFGHWFRSHGNELRLFNPDGCMAERRASINDWSIVEAERLIRRPQGSRPVDHLGLTGLGL